MSENGIALYLAEGGMDSASLEARVPETQYVRGTNIAIEKGLPTTRPGCRVLPLTGDSLEAFGSGNVQGAMFYNPSAGQGAVSYGTDRASILIAVAGRKYSVELEGRGLLTTGKVTDITNGVLGGDSYHLVCWSQWENYALAQDGNGNCFIWDGTNPAFASDGYNVTDKEASRVPNGGMAMAYVHGRGSVVVNGRAVLTSDGLNYLDKTGSTDVLAFRQQTYWATGQYFAPPTWMGQINALAVLPITDTAHGHGELMCHCEGGIFSIDLNVYPRSKWAETAMVKTTYIGSGAVGPYAVTLRTGDQIFRSKAGVQTLRSARAEANSLGAMQLPISEPVGDWFQNDAPRWLRFSTVETWETAKRVLVSCYPVVQGRWRWSRGLVVANFQPVAGKGSQMVWEGLWTLPPQMNGVVQQVNGKISGEERHLAVCRGVDGKNRLVEFRRELKADLLEDGSEHRIRCQLITRQIDAQRAFTKKNFHSGVLFLKNIHGKVDWGVWFRVAGTQAWRLWQSGVVENRVPTGCDAIPAEPGGAEIAIPLGEIPNDAGQNVSRTVQFLVRWAGYCSVEGITAIYQMADLDGKNFDTRNLDVRFCERATVDYDDYEYADNNEADSWLKEIQ